MSLKEPCRVEGVVPTVRGREKGKAEFFQGWHRMAVTISYRVWGKLSNFFGHRISFFRKHPSTFLSEGTSGRIDGACWLNSGMEVEG